MKNKSFLMFVIGIALSSQLVFADKKAKVGIFKCTNNKGDIYYNDKPCPLTDKEKRMRAVKDPQNVSKSQGSSPASPVVVKKNINKVKTGKRPIRKSINKRDDNLKIKELEGADKTLKAEELREENAGNSAADERRIRENERYNNPPKGSRRPASGAGTKEYSEEQVRAMTGKT